MVWILCAVISVPLLVGNGLYGTAEFSLQAAWNTRPYSCCSRKAVPPLPDSAVNAMTASSLRPGWGRVDQEVGHFPDGDLFPAWRNLT
jgi:hypothetical protein